MANYIVPQVLINQLISEVPLNTVRNQNVLVIGPNYQLFRFSEEKDYTYLGEYRNTNGAEGNGNVYDASGYEPLEGKPNIAREVDNLRDRPVYAYPHQADGTIPDASYTKVFADEVVIKLANLGDFFLFTKDGVAPKAEAAARNDTRIRFPYVISGNDLNKPVKYLKICTLGRDESNDTCLGGCDDDDGPFYWQAMLINSDSNDDTDFKPLRRSINPGDAIRIPYKVGDVSKVYRSTIVEVQESVEGSGIFDTVLLADLLPEDFTADNDLVTEASMLADPDVTNSVAYKVAKFSAAEDLVYVADYYYSEGCEGPTTDGEGEDVEAQVQLCAQFSDVEIPRKTNVRHIWNWDWYSYSEEGEDDVYGIVVTKNLRVGYSNWEASDPDTGKSPEYRVLSAKLYVQHRDLITSSAYDIASISSSTLVEATLGTIHPDNPLAFGTYMAALNSGDRLVYYCGVPTDDLSGYNTVLDKATLTDEVYMICPTTMDLSVAQAVKSHVEEMSTAQNKLWRIGFVSVEPPATDMIYDRTNKPSGDNFYAKFQSFTSGIESSRVLQFMESDDINDDRVDTTVRFYKDVMVGDVVKIWLDNSDDDWDETPHYTERYISKIIANNRLQLSKPVYVCNDPDNGYACKPDYIPEGKKNVHFKVEVYRKLTPTQQVKYIAGQSSQLATRRMYNVFPSIASNDGVIFDGSFLACAAAGLVSSVLPQQPLTNVALNGVSDIPITYQTYTKAQLDTIAAGGTFIIMQSRPNSQVYVRHQISTDYTSNNLMKAELSITKNLDSISYYFAELFAPYIGKYNITPELLRVLDNVLRGGLTRLENDTAAGLYGPQVIAEGTEILYLRQSEINRDHVECRVHLNLPVPFNYFDLDLEI